MTKRFFEKLTVNFNSPTRLHILMLQRIL